MKKIILGFSLLLGLLPLNVMAQKNIIDEVIWIIGDDYILKSDVEAQRLRAQNENIPIVGDPYCVFPEQIAIQKLFLHQAELDSITVSDSQVMFQVENRLNYFINELGSKERMEEMFRKSTADIRIELEEQVRNQMIIQEMQRKLVGNIKSTPAEIRRYFNQLPSDSVPSVPGQVEVQIISFEPTISIAETNRIKEQLRDFTERINSGKSDFSVLARLYSDDPGSSVRGGELGFEGKGKFVPEFAAVAFSLTDPKKVSRIVQTEYGYHIIQLIEKKGDRVNCRHILIKPKVSYEEKEKAIVKLDSISNLIRSEKLTFEQAVINYSQDKNTAMNAGLMINQETGNTKFEYQNLPPAIAKAAYSMNVGEISKPFTMISPTTNKDVVAVIKLKTKLEPHKANLVDDYQLIKSMYENKLQQEFLHNWIVKKQKETYISIDPKWANCQFQYPGWIKK